MSEINCLVLLNNPEKEIVLNMDNQVTYAMFNDEVRKNLQIDPNEPIQFSYFDSDGDRVLFNTEEEFKEFLNHAATIGYMITIFAYAQPNVESPQSSSASESQEPFESSNIVHREEEQQEKPAEEQETEILPSNVEDKQPSEQKEFTPQFNIKYQLPIGRQHHRKVQPGGEYKVVCDHCDQEITNLRYKCLQCPDYDLCENCEELRCKQVNNQIHPDDHIFAKIRHPIHRPVPFICVPGNSPIVCPRHGLRRIPVAPEHMRNKRENTLNNNNNNNNSSKLNNNNNRDNLNRNNNLTKEERAKAKRERRNERREGIKSLVEQRGEKIQELEDRIRNLEQQFAVLHSQTTGLHTVPQTTDNSNVYSETFDSQRKFWPFQC